MSEVGNVQQNEDRQTAVQQAADELATRLKTLAETLAPNAKTRRVPYGPGRLGKFVRRQSPEGYVLDQVSLRVLLPDGRLWTYSRSESTRFPSGRFFDARLDYPEFAGGQSALGGRQFVFLGAVMDKYSFGWAAPDDSVGDSGEGGLWAIYGGGRVVRWVTADEAFRAIAESTKSRALTT